MTKFDGDIIICDPICFICSEDWIPWCEHGYDLKFLGFTKEEHYDGQTSGASIVDADKECCIGDCIDDSIIVVAYLSEILNYTSRHPVSKIYRHLKNFGGILIKDFHGTIGLVKCLDERSPALVGTGNVNFYSSPTSDVFSGGFTPFPPPIPADIQLAYTEKSSIYEYIVGDIIRHRYLGKGVITEIAEDECGENILFAEWDNCESVIPIYENDLRKETK